VNSATGFILFLFVTLVFLGAVVVTGNQGRRRIHVVLVACALASLGTTIYFAERLGEVYDVQTAGIITPIHLTLAKVTTLAYILPVVTGVLTWRNLSWKRLHAKFAYLVLALTVLTAATGTLMVALSDRIPDA
jgi:hypothetical protein